jgi:hypothetical protein
LQLSVPVFNNCGWPTGDATAGTVGDYILVAMGILS